MNASRFDLLTRSLTEGLSRRAIYRGLAALLAFAGTPVHAIAKKKNKRKKPKKNAFGCLNVGKACNGKNGKCCSGICKGKRPKKGKKDKSECVAHNVSTCQDGADVCLGAAVTCSGEGACFRTTGNASFCAGGDGACTACQKDPDCVALGFGVGAACVVCNSECPETGGTVCFATGA